MKDTRPIEEQVAELTEEQKNTILKVDLITGLVTMLGTLPTLVLLTINCIAILNVSLSAEKAIWLITTNSVIIVVALVFVVGVLVFVKIKYPYYSGKKCDYIRKSCKNK